MLCVPSICVLPHPAPLPPCVQEHTTAMPWYLTACYCQDDKEVYICHSQVVDEVKLLQTLCLPWGGAVAVALGG